MCINKGTDCSLCREGQVITNKGEKKREGEGIQYTFIQNLFLQRLLVETLRVENRNGKRERTQAEPKHAYNHPGLRKKQDEKERKGKRGDETIVSYNEDRGSQRPRDTRRWTVCIHGCCNDVWSWGRKSERQWSVPV